MIATLILCGLVVFALLMALAMGWRVAVVRAAVAGGQIPSEQLSATSAPSQR
jgi:hypothetical protein